MSKSTAAIIIRHLVGIAKALADEKGMVLHFKMEKAE